MGPTFGPERKHLGTLLKPLVALGSPWWALVWPFQAILQFLGASWGLPSLGPAFPGACRAQEAEARAARRAELGWLRCELIIVADLDDVNADVGLEGVRRAAALVRGAEVDAAVDGLRAALAARGNDEDGEGVRSELATGGDEGAQPEAVGAALLESARQPGSPLELVPPRRRR